MQTMLLSGNEAIARGAWEAGCQGGFAYPGTPSTETMENFAKYPDVYAEWAINEKVALEAALGFSVAGRRALVAMKHVGVNVAADPLMTISYTGCNGGLVMLAADDPGMFSSQNEQDSRFYAQFARVPLFEPADSSEALQMTKEAFELSERLSTLAIIRSTVRISHTRTPVAVGERQAAKPLPYRTDQSRWVMMPAYARPKRIEAEARQDALLEYSESSPYNRIELRDASVGFVCSGAAYQHVREAFPEASTLKLGVTYPLPRKKIAEFFGAVQNVYVVDEASRYFQDAIASFGLAAAKWPNGLPAAFELSPDIIRHAMGEDGDDTGCCGTCCSPVKLPGRPPALCAGCPHRVPFFELKRMKAIALGDIGCYTLGALPPLAVVESAIDMGASISMGHGFELARTFDREEGCEPAGDGRPVFSVIGDSTFAHSGLSGVISTVYNAGKGNVMILDNRITGMTGGQGNPFCGITLQNRESHEVDLPGVLRALGVEDVREVNSHDVKAVREALKAAAKNTDQLSVVICHAPCVVAYKVRGKAQEVDPDKCRSCGACLRLGCPAISMDDANVSHIDPAMCNGCTQCAQYCPFDAIGAVKE